MVFYPLFVIRVALILIENGEKVSGYQKSARNSGAFDEFDLTAIS
jgi:hypothetical protein